MKFNTKNHWVEEMAVGETVTIEFQELKHTTRGMPYISALYDGDIIYANIGRWDEDRFKEGHKYNMTCTKCEYNGKSQRYYLQYKFEDVSFTPSTPEEENVVEETLIETVQDYLETQQGGDLDKCKEILTEMKDKYQQRVQALEFALEILR